MSNYFTNVKKNVVYSIIVFSMNYGYNSTCILGTGLWVRYAHVPNKSLNFFQEIQTRNGVLALFDMAWQIAV